MFDVADPTTPVLVGHLETSGEARDVVADAQHAYVADGGLDVVDVSDPANPRLVGRYPGSVTADSVALLGDYVIVNMVAAEVVNVSEPSNPHAVAVLDSLGWLYGVAVDGGYIYCADEASGLVIMAVHIPGDLNCDGRVDSGDINPLVMALCFPETYAARYPACHGENGDFNGDGTIGFEDINPFAALLHQGRSGAPVEPLMLQRWRAAPTAASRPSAQSSPARSRPL